MGYCYFVSYVFSGNEGTGWGNIEVLCEYKITSIEQVTKAAEQIKNRNKFKAVTVINYILLREE